MGFGSYGGSMIATTAIAMNSARRSSYYGGELNKSSDKQSQKKWYIKWLLILTAIICLCIYGCFFYGGSRTVDVTGTVFAKGTSYVHHKHHDDEVFIFAVKPDNPEWHKFDVKVTFSTYSSYNIGDKVKFNDIMKTDVGDKTWTLWNEIIGCLSFTIGIFAILGWLFFLLSVILYENN